MHKLDITKDIFEEKNVFGNEISRSFNIIKDKESGEPRLSHKIDISTGTYNGKKILIKKSSKDSKDNS